MAHPHPSVDDPRSHLLAAVLAFVRGARTVRGVLRIALVGSLATNKLIPKDADVLVTIDESTNLASLARAGRRLKGNTQAINLGADIFLANEKNQYIGRVCHYKKCHGRAACLALHCGTRPHLNDDLQVITLSDTLVRDPPIELWPRIVARDLIPADTERVLLAELAKDAAEQVIRLDGEASDRK